MLDTILSLFDMAQFVPHGMCLLWRPDLLLAHGLSDLLICAAYLAIPFTILKAIRRRPDLLDKRVAVLFAIFITACALSHLAALVTLWLPAYGIQGAIKIATAGVSIYTAIQLARLLPGFLTMPSRDEMAQKEAHVAFEKLRADRAQEARDKLSEFAHIASHDLKAPMRGIANHARFLIEDHGETLEPGARKRLDRMQELCGRMDELVATLLRYSRLGRSEAIEEVDTQAVIETLTNSLEEFLREKKGSLNIETRLPAVKANPSDVHTVFHNLIVNGLTYNRSDQKTVAVGFLSHADVNGELLPNVFYVRDNGIGIAPELHDAAFRMFKRLQHDDAFGTGNGAGLAFVKRVIESGGGDISLESEPGTGTTFYFSFRGRQTAGEKHISNEVQSDVAGDPSHA